MEHFGINVIKRKYGLKLVREEFAIINTKPSLPFCIELQNENAYVDYMGTKYREEWCKEYRKLCLKNYDLNMKYFSLLDKQEFNDTLNEYLNSHRNFVKVTDLSEYYGACGYYIMVLDEYKQIYIGKSDDLTRRIRTHWSNMKAFDRTLFPMYNYRGSVFSIDFFRALDTTRIYIWERSLSERLESKLISDFPAKFLTNRIGGDISEALSALLSMNKRSFDA